MSPRCAALLSAAFVTFLPGQALLGEPPPVPVWEVHMGQSPRPLTGIGHFQEFVGLAADGQTILTRSADGTLTIWDVRAGRRLRTLEDGEESIDRFLFGAEASRKRAMLRQGAGKGRQHPRFSKERLRDSVFSPDSTMLAIGSGQDGTTILLQKTAEGIEHRRLSAEAPVKQVKNRSSPGVVCQLAFAPDSRVLAITYSEGFLILWDTLSRQPQHVAKFPRHGDSYRSLAFSSDGRLLALSDRWVVNVVETASGQQFWKRPLSEHWVDSLAFAPDNRTLSIGDAGSEAAIHLWDLATNKELDTLLGHRDSIETLVFSPDGSFLYSGSGDRTILRWDVATLLRRRSPSKKLSPAKLTELWTDLASKDAARGQRAVGALIQAPEAALPFLEKSLPPVTPAEAARMTLFIADLDHAEFVRREKASRELEKMGEPAVPVLRKALTQKPSLEVRRRIEMILDAMEAQRLSPNWLRPIRALQVLEAIGTPAARRIFEGLAHGAAEALLTQDAKAALQRLERRQTKP